jgi:hypothetical protein
LALTSLGQSKSEVNSKTLQGCCGHVGIYAYLFAPLPNHASQLNTSRIIKARTRTSSFSIGLIAKKLQRRAPLRNNVHTRMPHTCTYFTYRVYMMYMVMCIQYIYRVCIYIHYRYIFNHIHIYIHLYRHMDHVSPHVHRHLYYTSKDVNIFMCPVIPPVVSWTRLDMLL